MTDGSFGVFLLQLVRECKEVLKGGLLMKQYYQFMLREVLDDLKKIDCNIDSFEEDLHKMLMVSFKKESSNKCINLNTANRNLLPFLGMVTFFSFPTLIQFYCFNELVKVRSQCCFSKTGFSSVVQHNCKLPVFTKNGSYIEL